MFEKFIIFINGVFDKSSMKERKQKEEICVRTCGENVSWRKQKPQQEFNVQWVSGCALFCLIFIETLDGIF